MPDSNLFLQTPPAGEPVTVPEAKLQLSLDGGEHDDQVEIMIQAAREFVEERTGRQWMKAIWELKLPGFWEEQILLLPRPPLLSVTSITYRDADNQIQTLSAAVYRTLLRAARSPFGGIALKDGQGWPTVYSDPEAVTIRFVAGYSASDEVAVQRAAVPARARSAMLHLVHDLFEERGVTGVGSVRIPDNPRYEDLLSQLAVPRLESQVA